MVATLATLDLNDPAVMADPYPSYARLRDEPCVTRSETLGWLIARHADVSALLHDRRLGNGPLNAALYAGLPDEALAAIEPFQTGMSHNMLFQDAPDHTRLRRLVSQAFTPRRIQSLRGAVEQIMDGLLEEWRAGDSADVIADLAFPLPGPGHRDDARRALGRPRPATPVERRQHGVSWERAHHDRPG